MTKEHCKRRVATIKAEPGYRIVHPSGFTETVIAWEIVSTEYYEPCDDETPDRIYTDVIAIGVEGSRTDQSERGVERPDGTCFDSCAGYENAKSMIARWTVFAADVAAFNAARPRMAPKSA